jgi:hypothetical protein
MVPLFGVLAWLEGAGPNEKFSYLPSTRRTSFMRLTLKRVSIYRPSRRAIYDRWPGERWREEPAVPAADRLVSGT